MKIHVNTPTNGPVAEITNARFIRPRMIGSRLMVATLAMLGMAASAYAQPAIFVTYVDAEGDTISVFDGDTVELEDTFVGEEINFSWTVTSVGTEALTAVLSTTPKTNNLLIKNVGMTQVATFFAGGINYETTAAGLAEIEFTLFTNDPDHPQFKFTILTEAFDPPTLFVSTLGEAINAGDELDLGTFEVDEAVAFLFEIRNQGGGVLELDSVTATTASPNVADLTAGFTEIFPNENAGGANWDLTDAGEFEVTVRILSNDPNTPLFSFSLKGVVEAEEVQIVDCDSNGLDDGQEIQDDPTKDCDESGILDYCEADIDQDGYIDACDNCPEEYNPEQSDADLDGYGDACDQEEEIVCTDDYEPVCGKDGQTYSNGCHASAAGMEVDYEGECMPLEEIDTNGQDVDTNGQEIDTNGQVEPDEQDLPTNGVQEEEEDGEQKENEQEQGQDEQGQELQDDVEDGQQQGGGARGAMCGAGGAGMLPILMLGMCCAKAGLSRSRRTCVVTR